MQISVSKYHGCGNDFIIAREADAEGVDRAALVRAACDRHLGIGADGMILVREQPLEMLYYNQDGSRAPMCGNGIRCFAAFCYDEGICTDTLFPVQTLAGEKQVKRIGTAPFLAEIGMGKPEFAPQKLDLDEEVLSKLKEAGEKQAAGKQTSDFSQTGNPDGDRGSVQALDTAAEAAEVLKTLERGALCAGKPKEAEIWGLPVPISLGGKTVTCSIYSFFMSTHHTVVFVKDAFAEEIEALGYAICHHPLFRAQTNVNFVEYIDRSHLRMQTYERGCGMTLACGTGACATVVCAHRLGLCGSETDVLLRCGKLHIKIGADEQVIMTGPAKRVMKGSFFFAEEEK